MASTACCLDKKCSCSATGCGSEAVFDVFIFVFMVCDFVAKLWRVSAVGNYGGLYCTIWSW